jgi:WS/DGAT/MGAT family acyltransferase
VKQLSGVDASFLYMETPSQFGHVSSLTLYDPSSAPGGAGFEETKRRLEQRLPALAPFRRRLVEVPFGLDHPYWINDPDFDIDFHLRHTAVPPPGDDGQLGELVARLIARPMDRTRPLWELWVIEGLASGEIAQLTKFHHATIDGAAGAQMIVELLDLSPDQETPTPEPIPWEPEPVPTDVEMFLRGAASLARQPLKFARWQARMMQALAESTRNRGVAGMAQLAGQVAPAPLRNLARRANRSSDEVDVAPAMPAIQAPATPFNKAITPHRRFAFVSVDLDDAKAVKNAFGTTINDVVMAVSAGALRRWLIDRDALPTDPLIAMVPVSIRTGAEEDVYSNRVSGMLAGLATNLERPVDRLLAINASMKQAKETFNLIPADVLTDFSQFAFPAVFERAARMASRVRMADRMNPPFNLVISNVPGPRMPLYAGGARMTHFYPVSTITDGGGLNITVQSYLDRLDFGLVACRELIPDLWELAGFLADELDELVRAAKG